MTISLQIFAIACFVCLLIGSAITLAVGAIMVQRTYIHPPSKRKPAKRPDTSNYCECDMHNLCKSCTREGLWKCYTEGLYSGYKRKDD